MSNKRLSNAINDLDMNSYRAYKNLSQNRSFKYNLILKNRKSDIFLPEEPIIIKRRNQ